MFKQSYLLAITFLRHLRSKQFVRQFIMSLTSIFKGKQSNDFNAPSTIKILLQLFLVFLYFYGWNKIAIFLQILKGELMQKQPSRGILRKRCSENMQQIYKRTPMLKCDFNKVARFSPVNLLHVLRRAVLKNTSEGLHLLMSMFVVEIYCLFYCQYVLYFLNIVSICILFHSSMT